jgi:predicted MFS family arabinose efflux permease
MGRASDRLRRRTGRRRVPGPGAAAQKRVPMFSLLGANGISQIGNMTLIVAGPWFVLETTGSAAMTGVVGAAHANGTVIPPVLGGPLIDWLGFKRGSVLPDVISSASVGAIPLLHLYGLLQFWHLVLIVFVLASMNSQGDAARLSLVPDLAQRAGMSPEAANGADRAVVRLGSFLGPLLGGFLITLIGASNVLFIDAVTFLLSAALVAFGVPSDANRPKGVAPVHRGYLSDLVAGWRLVRRTKVALTMILIATGSNFLNVPLIAVVLPVYAKEVYGSAATLGIMLGAYGAGTFGGTALFGAIGRRLPRRGTFIACWVISPLVIYAVLSLTPPLAIVVLAGIVAGLVAGPINPLYMMTIQERTPPEMLGRTFGSLTALAQAGVPLGSVLAGVALQVFGLVPTLMGMGVIVLGITLSMLVNPALRQMDARRDDRE